MTPNKTDLSKTMPIFLSILKNTNFKGYSFIFIHHLTITNKLYLEEWIKRTDTLGLISIPYSEIQSVKKSIQEITTVITPKNISGISDATLKLIKKYPNKKIVLVEVGGYSSEISSKLKNVKLCIEDTYQGHWLQQEKHEMQYPVVSIADTQAKKVENRYIGESVVMNVEKILKGRHILINNKKVIISVISYGGIGESVCLALRNRGIYPYVYDTDVFKTSMAVADGYKVASRDSILNSSDVIIACSGKSSICEEDIKLLKPNSYLFSGSSKKVEFQDLIRHIDKKDNSDDIQTLKFTDKNVYIGYYGQPINFLDITDARMFDVPFSLQLECFNYFRRSILKNKLYSLPKKYQEEILLKFVLNNYSI